MSDHYIVYGLAFGDEAKGATTDLICSEFGGDATVVRFSGGAQAAHNVIADGKHHTFRQFGSGTFTGARTYLSRYMMIEPTRLVDEVLALEALGIPDPLRLLSVAPDALVTTAFHTAATRTREDLRGRRAHGSTGVGIGETIAYALACRDRVKRGDMVGDFEAPADAAGDPVRMADCRAGRKTLTAKLDAMARFYRPLIEQGDHTLPSVGEQVALLEALGGAVRVADVDSLRPERHLVFEGSQGVLLDENYGFHPHTTWATTTPANAIVLAGELGITATKIGVARLYGTRHGHGPFPTEDSSLDFDEPHNEFGKYQGEWRVGHLDMVALRYAVAVSQPDMLAVTHADRTGQWVCAGYASAEGWIRNLPSAPEPGLDRLEHSAGLTSVIKHVKPIYSTQPPLQAMEALGVPIHSIASGPDRTDRTVLAAV